MLCSVELLIGNVTRQGYVCKVEQTVMMTKMTVMEVTGRICVMI